MINNKKKLNSEEFMLRVRSSLAKFNIKKMKNIKMNPKVVFIIIIELIIE